MPARINIELTEEARATIKAIGSLPVEGMQAMARAMDRENQLTISHMMRKYLSFPRSQPPVPMGLRVISNRLRSSYYPTPTIISGARLESAIGSNVSYAPVHEFGFDGEQAVRAHTRRVFRHTSSTGRRLKKRVDTGNVVQVKDFVRNMHIPARAPVQRSIEDRQERYGQALSDAVITTLSK